MDDCSPEDTEAPRRLCSVPGRPERPVVTREDGVAGSLQEVNLGGGPVRWGARPLSDDSPPPVSLSSPSFLPALAPPLPPASGDELYVIAIKVVLFT